MLCCRVLTPHHGGRSVAWFFQPDQQTSFRNVSRTACGRGLGLAPDQKTLATAPPVGCFTDRLGDSPGFAWPGPGCQQWPPRWRRPGSSPGRSFPYHCLDARIERGRNDTSQACAAGFGVMNMVAWIALKRLCPTARIEYRNRSPSGCSRPAGGNSDEQTTSCTTNGTGLVCLARTSVTGR